MRGATHGGVQKHSGTNEADRRRDGSRKSATPQPVVAHQGQHERVRQRQPHGAELIVAGLARIDYAARDIQMRFGIAIIQSPAGMIYVNGGRGADRDECKQHQTELEPEEPQNSVKSRNSWKRASISLRVSVRKRSTPNFSQQ